MHAALSTTYVKEIRTYFRLNSHDLSPCHLLERARLQHFSLPATIKMATTTKRTMVFLTWLAATTTCLSFTSTVPNTRSFCGRQQSSPWYNKTQFSSPVVSTSASRSNQGQLRMAYGAPAPALKVGIAAVTGAVTGGVFAGGLHAIAGKFWRSFFLAEYYLVCVCTATLRSKKILGAML